MKKRFWLLTIFLFFLSLYFVVEAYGLFETNYKSSVTQSIGEWKIKLNNADISKGILENFDIQNFYYDENENVSEGYIAPGSRGYFDITIDPSGTEVAVKYNIVIDLTNDYPDNINISVEDLTGGNAVLVGLNEYSGVIGLLDILDNKTITIRVNIEWLNNENYDEDDSLLGSNSSQILIPVEVKIEQYLGENITSSSISTPSECFTFSNGIIYNYDSTLENCGVDVKIPDIIDQISVTQISQSAFENEEIVSIKIPETVTEILNNSFSNNNLDTIKFPRGLTIISNNILENNKLSLLDLRYLSNLNTIGNSAFKNNLISSLKLPNSIININDLAFCDNLIMSLDFSKLNKLEVIGANAFSNNSLETVVLSSSVTSIGASAFLKSDVSNSNLTTIINNTGNVFDFGLIVNGISNPEFIFETGTIINENGNVIVTTS